MKKNSPLILLFFIFFMTQAAVAQTYTDPEYVMNKHAFDALGLNQVYTSGGGVEYEGLSGAGVTVAVVDAGVLTDHTEFIGKWAANQEENNKYASPHGTQVAGVIGAAKNDLGMHGVAYKSSLLSFSTLLDGDGGCTDTSLCITTEKAWELLATDAFNGITIINNSWGAGTNPLNTYTPAQLAAERAAAKALVEKDKLIIAAAGNEMKLYPNVYPAALPYYDETLKNNIISVIAYDSSKSKSDPRFIASFSNLAQDAVNWSVAAPGVGIYTATNTGIDQYAATASGTSIAAPMVSGVAALIQEAFPYMGGKQIADVLLSTTVKDYQNFSDHMAQYDSSTGKLQVLFFIGDGATTTWTTASKNSAVSTVATSFGISKSGCTAANVTCVEITYEQVFGQGLVNAANAIKGPGHFDANRLTSEDFNDGQYYYSVDVLDNDSVWSNNIGQIQSGGSNPEADIGLQKSGIGKLTLSGTNTFLGNSIVEAGVLEITGSIKGGVIVNSAAELLIDGGVVEGKVSVNSFGSFTLETGTIKKEVELGGISSIKGGTLSEDVTNSGSLVLSGGTFSKNLNNSGSVEAKGGTIMGKVINESKITLAGGGTTIIQGGLENISGGEVTANGGTINGAIVNRGQFVISGYQGDPDYEAGILTISVPFENEGMLGFSKGAELHGDLLNKGTLRIAGTDTKITGTITNTAGSEAIIVAGSVLDLNGQTFHNAGNISGLGTINNGTVNSTGTVNSSLNLDILNSSGRIYVVPQEGSVNPDFLSVNTANITGGSFALSPDQEVVYRRNQTYTILSASNSLNVDFSNFQQRINLTGFITATADQNGNDLNMFVEYLRISDTANTPTFNEEERKVAEVFDRMYLDSDNEDFIGYYYYTEESLKKEINKLRRQVQSIQVEALPLSGTITNNVYSHLFQVQRTREATMPYRPNYMPTNTYRGKYYRGRGGAGEEPMTNNLWAQFIGGMYKVKGDNSEGRETAESKLFGGMVGWDKEVSENFMWGLTTGFAATRQETGQDETKVKDYRAGIYMGSRMNRFTVDAIAMVGYQKYDTDRYTDIVGMKTHTNASFNGYTVEAGLNLGFDWSKLPLRDHSFHVRTYVSSNVSYMSQDAYEEKGTSSLLLSVDSMDDTSVTIQPGITIGYTWADAVLTFDIGWQHLVTGGEPRVTASFMADTTQTKFEGLITDPDKNYLSLGLGFKSHISERAQLHLWADTKLSDNTSSVNLSASVRYSF